MIRRHPILALIVVSLVVVAGCGGLGGEPDVEVDDADDVVDTADDVDDVDNAADRAPQRLEDEIERLAVQDRQIIRTGHVEVEVTDVDTAIETLRTEVQARNGYFESSDRQVRGTGEETWETANVVLRVPSEDFDATMDEAQALGEVRQVETETEDVSDQLVDLEARLANLATQRDRLRELMEATNDTRDVLAVQEELADVQERIERLEAQQQQLQDQVAFSTITVDLAEPEPDPVEPAPEEQWWEMGVLTAFLSSVGGVVTVMRAMVVAAALAAPYVLVFGPAVAGVGFILHRMNW